MAKSSDKLQRLRIFCTVARHGSFSNAAKALKLAPPTVSKAVQLLESELCTRLLIRTTRSVTLTETGQQYFERASAILLALEELDAETQQAAGLVHGKLNITAPAAFGEHVLGYLIPEFLKRYPDVSIELDLSGDVRDLKRDGFDIGFRNKRAGHADDYYYLPIRSLTPSLVASPGYLARHGRPIHPEQLAEHEFVIHRGGQTLFNRWRLTDEDGKTFFFEAHGRYVSNNIQNSIIAAKEGLGIVNTYAFYVEEDIRAGKLVRLFSDYRQPDVERFAYYHQRRTTSAKLDAFLAFIEEKIGLRHDDSC